MKDQPKDSQPASEPTREESPDEFKRFEALTKRLLGVSKRELDDKRNGG